MKLPNFFIGRYTPIRRPVYEANLRLAAKQAEQRAKLPENSVKSLHERAPEPLDYEGLPIG